MTLVDDAAREWWNDNEWHYVASSNVTAFRYDRDGRALTIEFHGHRRYLYFNIPEDMAGALAAAPSAGQWFHANLKGAPFERL
jgi:hypothetical protein